MDALAFENRFFYSLPDNLFFAFMPAAACSLHAAISTLAAGHPKCGLEISSMTKSSSIEMLRSKQQQN